MRAGTELLFLPRCSGCLPHRLLSGGGRLLEIPLFLLHHRHSDFAWGVAGAGHLRISMPLWLVSGAAAQNPHQEVFHQAPQTADLSEIHHSGGDGGAASHSGGQRPGHGRPLLLQVPVSPGRAGRCPSSGCRQRRHSGSTGQAVHLEGLPAVDGGAGQHLLLPPLL